MFQFTLKRLLIALSCIALTFGYWCWFYENYNSGTYFVVHIGPLIRAMLICGCGIGASIGLLLDKRWGRVPIVVGIWLMVLDFALR